MSRLEVYHDSWVSTSNSLRILSPHVLPEDLCEADLITPSGCWIHTLVRASFSTDEAEAILKLPIGGNGRCDELGWDFSNCGRYSVRSGY